ncbi:Uncharacterised protein [uncultured archaeon]|nr:Uncharacterised protein [uncultured archaeon]
MSRSSGSDLIPLSKYSSGDVQIARLKLEHANLLGAFSSRDGELNEFLQKDALEYQKLHLGVTYLLLDRTCSRVISYITLSMGSLKVPDHKEFVLRGRKLADYPKDFPMQFPALLIGRLATDRKEEGRGGAHILLDLAVEMALKTREDMGCGFLLAHAVADERVVGWYKKSGFKAFVDSVAGRETVPMYFELG